MFLLSNFQTFLVASAIWRRDFKRNRDGYLAAGEKWREIHKSWYRERLTTADLAPRSRLGCGEEGPVGDGGILAGHPAGPVGVPGCRGQLHPDTRQLAQLDRGEDRPDFHYSWVGQKRPGLGNRKAFLRIASGGYSMESLLTKHLAPQCQMFCSE